MGQPKPLCPRLCGKGRALPKGAVAPLPGLVFLLRKGIRAGVFDPFEGPLYAQDGRRMADEGQTLSTEQIINMNWLTENIVGAIPDYDQLDEVGKATVGIVGVEPPAEEPK